MLLILFLVPVSLNSQDTLPSQIVIPTKAGVELLPKNQLAYLEILYTRPLTKAIEIGDAIPGESIDLNHPAVQYVYNFQRWIKIRQELVEKFGPDIFSTLMDVKEIEAWNHTEDSWDAYESHIDRCIKQWKATKKSWRRMQSAVRGARHVYPEQ